MASEVTIYNQIKIVSGNLNYQPVSVIQTDNLERIKGPSPGALTATNNGIIVTFSELQIPGWCRIQNLDQSIYIEYGLWDTINSSFIPLFELPPGMANVVKFSQDFQYYYGGDQTGTGTGPSNFRFMIKARTDSAIVLVECFDS